VQLHHAEPWYDGQACDSNIPLLPFQSGFKARIQMARLYSYFPYRVAVQTCPYHFKCAVLPNVHPSAPFSTIPGFPTLPKAYDIHPTDVMTPVIH